MTQPIALNFNKTLIVSALLHAGFFAAALLLSAKTISPQPLGVELTYEAVRAVAKNVHVARPSNLDKKEVSSQSAETPTMASSSALQKTAAIAQSGATSGREGVSHGSEVSPEERYLYELKKLLERRKSYPMLARKMGHMGTVMMRFTLKADGTLIENEVLAKAPYETLNQAASTLVQGINGLKPFPQEIKRDSWSITVPIEYTLN